MTLSTGYGKSLIYAQNNAYNVVIVTFYSADFYNVGAAAEIR